jgi:hypothetical protein
LLPRKNQQDPLSFTVKYKTQKKVVSSKLLECFKAEGETFLTQTVKADATWVHHFKLQTKGQSTEWNHPQFPQQKKFKESVSRQGHDHCLLGL